MAADTMECCSLARRLALQLTDGLKDDTGMMDDGADQVCTHTTAGMNGAAYTRAVSDGGVWLKWRRRMFCVLIELANSAEHLNRVDLTKSLGGVAHNAIPIRARASSAVVT